MTVYINSEYRCFAADGPGLRAVEVPAFDGKAPDVIEGYRFIPASESWTDENGVIIEGRAMFAWQNVAQLEAAQHAYERLLADVSGSYRRGVDSI